VKNPIRLLLRVPVPWVFVLSYLVGVGLEVVWPPDLGSTGALLASHALGALLFVVGALIAAWSLVIFRKARTTTVPGRASNALVTWGPYRFSRNPMYVGLSLAYLGEAGILAQLWPLLLLPLTLAYVNWTVIPLEETRLEEVFPAEYADYRSSVRRWI
jgi:protein-S-isoprenylcysteine O-methyltransferase Ste14